MDEWDEPDTYNEPPSDVPRFDFNVRIEVDARNVALLSAPRSVPRGKYKALLKAYRPFQCELGSDEFDAAVGTMYRSATPGISGKLEAICETWYADDTTWDWSTTLCVALSVSLERDLVPGKFAEFRARKSRPAMLPAGEYVLMSRVPDAR